MELLSPMHLLLIFAVALLIFGPKKLPELGKGIGEGFRALKDGMKDAKDKPVEQAATSSPVSNAPPSSANTEVKG